MKKKKNNNNEIKNQSKKIETTYNNENSPYIMPNAYMGMNYFSPYMYPQNQMGQIPQMMPFPNYYGFQQNNQIKDNKIMPRPMYMPMYFPFGMNQMNNIQMKNQNQKNQGSIEKKIK